MHSRVPFYLVRPSVYVVVLCSSRHGRRSGVPFCLGWPLVCLVVFRCAWCSKCSRVLFGLVRHTRWCSVLSGVAFGMHGGPLFCPTQHAWRSSVLLSVACMAFFHSVWHGHRYAWRSFVPLSVAYMAGFHSAWSGIRGSVPFCLARPGVRGHVSGSSKVVPGYSSSCWMTQWSSARVT